MMAMKAEQISNIFSDTKAHKKLADVLVPDTLSWEEMHELACRIESFVEQEIKEIIHERWHDTKKCIWSSSMSS